MNNNVIRKLALTFFLFVFFYSCDEHKEKEKRMINGKEVEAVFLRDGSITGMATFFDSMGNIINRANYKNGVEDGVSLNYFLNGQTSDSMNFQNGLRNGYQYRFDTLGSLNACNFFYYGLKVGPDILYSSNRVKQYFFTDFNKEDLIDVRYDSKGELDSILLFKTKLAVTKLLVGDTHMTGIFFYLPNPPGATIDYSFGLRGKDDKENVIFEVNRDRVFIDTVITTPLKNEHYFVKASIKSNGSNFNRVYLDEVVW
ncbi:MAG: hypothetical protein BGO54_01930 [Sphingobacteriales bacterium 46-32]|nr:MAG: hypothetical protein BGO54_01930 [Sphingobacteriales bacterium 46-32]